MSATRDTSETYRRVTADFESDGQRCAAWLFLPTGIERPPVVVMAHGFAAQRDFKLPEVAARFTKRGIAALVFDYRHLGESDGTPKNLISVNRQLADLRAAIAHLRERTDVDADRLGLWGTSFGGGHVITTAAQDAGVKAVVSQIPFVDGPSAIKKVGWRIALWGTLVGTYDTLRSVLGLSPYYVPVVGQPGERAVMNREGNYQGYMDLVPDGKPWPNHCAARVMFAFTFYSPMKYAAQVHCPTLVLMAQDEELNSRHRTRQMVKRLPHGTLQEFPGRHFAAYQGKQFEYVMHQAGEFFSQHLAM